MAPEFEPSALFSRVFDDPMIERPFTVLDVGGASPETFEFLSGLPCKIYVTGLLEDGWVPEPPTEEDPYRAHRAFTDRLAWLGGVTFDVCLFWDYPNYLPRPTLQAFAEVLSAHLGPQTRGHVFAGLNNQQTLPAVRYGLSNRETLSLRPLNQLPPAHVHTQGEVADAFHYFKAARSSLRDGRVEVLLEHV